MGLDDVRRFCLLQDAAIPCYASPQCAADIRRVFDYALVENVHLQKSFCPLIDLHEVEEPFDLFGRRVVPVPLIHHGNPILGFRIGNFAYCTDCSEILADSLALLADLDVLVLGALRTKPHPAHLSISQAIQVAKSLSPRQTFFIHFGHSVKHDQISRELPDGISLSYDGLSIDTDSSS